MVIMTLFPIFALTALASSPLYRKMIQSHKIYTQPTMSSTARGYAAAGSYIQIVEDLVQSSSEDCVQGWARLQQGFICLDATEETYETQDTSWTLSWAPPQPSESNQDYWIENWQPHDDIERLVPRLHARIKEGNRGRLWASATAYEDGERANWRLKESRDYSFVDVVETERGWVLVRPNGRVSPVDEWLVYPVSRFEGRHLSYDPVPLGQQAAWVVSPQGALVYSQPDDSSNSIWTAVFQESLNLRPFDEEWMEIPDVLGSNKHAYIRTEDVAIWTSQSPPNEVNKNSIWVDVDIEEQILALMFGEEPLFITLISSAKPEFETPVGIFSIYKKALAWDLASKPDAQTEIYYLEQVPWVMHYYPIYALHSAFWHDDFGIPSSHGCINLSPRDAAYIFEYMKPDLPEGWKRTQRFSGEDGSIVRIRQGDEIDVPVQIIRRF